MGTDTEDPNGTSSQIMLCKNHVRILTIFRVKKSKTWTIFELVPFVLSKKKKVCDSDWAVALMANDWLKLGLKWFDARFHAFNDHEGVLTVRPPFALKNQWSQSKAGKDCSKPSEKWMDLPLKFDVNWKPSFPKGRLN